MGDWNKGEKAAFAPLEKLLPSEWAARYRVLPSTASAERFSLARTPYVPGIMDATKEPGVEEIVLVAGTQSSKSTTVESLIGYWVDNDPGPIMLVAPNEAASKETMAERIQPLIEITPEVSRHSSPRAHDSTLSVVKFDTCSLYMAWAGSPATLARRAIRRVLLDEVDKYPRNAGLEADPISLAIERTATYGYRKTVFITSTPTVRGGAVWRAWEACGDKRRFHCPCPHCGEYQILVFGQIKYPPLAITDKHVYADTIEQQNLAFYECVHCRKAIREKTRMIAGNGTCPLHLRWLSEGQKIDKAGVITGSRPKSKRVGFWINALYSPWRSFSQIAAEHRRCLNDPGRMQNFKNSWLAEPWEEVVKTASVEDFRALLAKAPRAGIVPRWANYIIASADVQKDRMYWIVRAWGWGHRSQLIAYGLAGDFADLKKQTLDMQWTLEAGGTARPHVLMIDSGYRTDEVYEFARTDERINPTKGGTNDQKMLVTRSNAGIQWGVPLWLLNTQLLKDRLSVFRQKSGQWLLNDRVDENYLQHLASEQKQLVRGIPMWMPKSDGTANHYLDCEAYNVAGAEICRVDLLTGEPETQPAPQVEPEVVQRGVREEKSFLGNTSGWL